MPEYAGQTLRHAMVELEIDEWRRPLKVTGIDTSVWDFDDTGDITSSVARRRAEGRQSAKEVKGQDVSGQVVDLSPRLRQRDWVSENNWKVGMKEMNQIIMAIWQPVHRK